MAASVPRKAFAALTPDTTTFSAHEDAVERVAFIPSPEIEVGPSTKGTKSLRDRLSTVFKDNQGLLLIGASHFFGPCMNISVQALNRLDPPVPPTEILVFRQSITWILTVVYMWYQDVPHPITGPPEVRLLLIVRGVCGFCGVFGMYFSLQYLSLSDATVLTFLSPFFTSFTGTFFLGEAFSRRNFFAGLCSLLGVVLIARPEAIFGPLGPAQDENPNSAARGTSHQRLLAVAVSMIGVFGASGAYTSLRAIGKRAHTLHSMTYFAFFSGIISAALMAVSRTRPVIPPEWKSCALLILISMFGFMAQLLLIMGLQRETASRGSLAMYIQIVFASVLERVFFHVTPSILSLSGTAIILSSAIYVGLTKNQDERQHEIRDPSSRSDGGAARRMGGTRDHMICAAEEATALLEEGFALQEFSQEDDEDKPSVGLHT